MRQFRRVSGSKVGASNGKDKASAWAHIGVYHGPHHERFQDQCLEEFLSEHPEQGAELTEQERESIRRGCIMLKDAIEGRGLHGLYSLLEEPAWKRVLFKIQTHDNWQNVVLAASWLHAYLIAFEPPNWRATEHFPGSHHRGMLMTEIVLLCIYAFDVAMKMLYFKGWSDYVSKPWQRNYVIFISLFTLDLLLYHAGLSPLRFSRPLRLCIIAGRHRDVRRLISTIPKMCSSLLTQFAIPLVTALGIFSVIVHRFHDNLPEEMQPDLEHDGFGDVLSTIRSLFVLSTLSNWDPVVTNTYNLHPWSALPFMVFLIVCSFFLMSVALGVVYDIYIDDHERLVHEELVKQTKLFAKCFKKLDLNQNGVLEWRLFCEMMFHLRPHDRDIHHNYLLFREVASVPDQRDTKMPARPIGIDQEAFSHMQDWLSVYFKKVNSKEARNVDWWARLEYFMVLADAACVAFALDESALPSSFFSPIFSKLLLGDVQVLLLVAMHAWLLVRFGFGFIESLSDVWRIIDVGVLYLSLCFQLASSFCLSAQNGDLFFCRSPQKQVFKAMSALRILRVVLHNTNARQYLLSVGQVMPVLMHFGSLVLCFLYFSAVVAMELLAKEPKLVKSKNNDRISFFKNQQCPVTYENLCSEKLPNFDCAGSAMLSMFMMFTGTEWHEVAYVASPKTNGHGELWNGMMILYFFACYIILGIILCNLLTTLIVEFHKVVSVEAEALCKAVSHSKETQENVRRRPTLKAVAKTILTLRKLHMSIDQASLESIAGTETELQQVHEIMIGKKRNWRLRLSDHTASDQNKASTGSGRNGERA